MSGEKNPNLISRIRFGLELLLKVLMHTFYLVSVGACCHAFHLLLSYADVSAMETHLQVLTYRGGNIVLFKTIGKNQCF